VNLSCAAKAMLIKAARDTATIATADVVLLFILYLHLVARSAFLFFG
jgi:hypothetical protein